MQELAALLVCLGLFGALYVTLRRRQAGDGPPPPGQWGWLAAIVGLAAAVFVIGLLTG